LVVAPGVKFSGWAASAALAAGFLGLLAFHGERPEPGLARFEPAGVLVDWPIEDVATLDVFAGTAHRSFHRIGGSWRGEGEAMSAQLEERIATGLKLLHNSAPERIFAASELGEQTLADFGLEPPRLTVAARTAEGRSVTIHFGNVNPLGLARYTRIDGRPEVVLLPAFVAKAWERVMEPR
jgi:hypothetical protein